MIILKGEPRTTNHVWKSAARGGFVSVYMSKEGKALKESYQWQAKSQWHKPIISGPLAVHIKLFMGTKRKCDIDNYHKLSLDALTGIVWIDDSQIVRMTVEKGYDKDNPRIEIEVDVPKDIITL